MEKPQNGLAGRPVRRRVSPRVHSNPNYVGSRSYPIWPYLGRESRVDLALNNDAYSFRWRFNRTLTPARAYTAECPKEGSLSSRVASSERYLRAGKQGSLYQRFPAVVIEKELCPKRNGGSLPVGSHGGSKRRIGRQSLGQPRSRCPIVRLQLTPEDFSDRALQRQAATHCEPDSAL